MMEVLVEDKWISTRFEMAWNENGNAWYLVGTPYYGDLEYVRARI